MELTRKSWSKRRVVLKDLELSERTRGRVVPTLTTYDGTAMYEATAAVGAEGLVSKRRGSSYRAGGSKDWVKIKHRVEAIFDVGGWLPKSSMRPAQLVLSDNGEFASTAGIALSDEDRGALAVFFDRYGRSHPTGFIAALEGVVKATGRYTSRTAVRRHLREAVNVATNPP